MSRRASDETVDRAYVLADGSPALGLSVAREGFDAFVVVLPRAGAIRVGRDAQAELPIASPSLSRLHLAVEVDGEAATVRDLGSRNGTLLGRSPVGEAPVPLPLGAELVAGDVRFSLLRLSSLPSVARPLLLLGVLESELALRAGEPTALVALELSSPLNAGRAVFDTLAQLPIASRVALVDDSTLVAALPDASLVGWLVGALAARGAAVAKQAVREGASGNVVPALLRELAGRQADEGAGAPDTPPAFQYASLRKIHHDLRKIAPRPISVLVTGETGTGKEVVARELHRLSGRTGPLVAVNTAALPENLIESELFGHERGAFSGAQTAKAGLIETADKGTLFLDEIGELSLPLQAKLLRVLEDLTVRRVGATTERKVDLRVVAATHQDLMALAKEKRFRQDLLFRLNGATISLPPLRDRHGEIGPLASSLLGTLAAGGRTPALDPAALAALESYGWPGNVRELRHVLERAVAFADSGVITVEHLPATIVDAASGAPPRPASGDVRATVKDFERERILEALRAAGGNRTRAAEILGLPRRTLVYKLSKMKLDDE